MEKRPPKGRFRVPLFKKRHLQLARTGLLTDSQYPLFDLNAGKLSSRPSTSTHFSFNMADSQSVTSSVTTQRGVRLHIQKQLARDIEANGGIQYYAGHKNHNLYHLLQRKLEEDGSILLQHCSNMTYKPRAGGGAKAKILTRMIYPRRNLKDKKDQSIVILIGEEEKIINKKNQQCYTFVVEGDDETCYAIKQFVHVFEEGDKSKLFDPNLPGPEEKSKETEKKLPKWRKSKAKTLLYEFLVDGTVPMEDDPNMQLEDIYCLDLEFEKYDFRKFKVRLDRLRAKIKENDSRAEEDLVAFRTYKKNHKPSMFSHKGYCQWQGSTAQEHLWDDLDAYLKDLSKKPKDLWASRKEYRDEFPLCAFRDKIKQEIRTDKYLKTRKARDGGKKV
jgi:hypothetical protein